MRYVDALRGSAWRRCLMQGALCAVVAGCASIDAPLNSLKGLKESFAAAGASPQSAQAQAEPAVERSQAGASAASAPGHVAAAAPRTAPTLSGANAALDNSLDSSVSAAAQQAFDEARRALRAGRLAEAERGFKALSESHPELGGAHANLGLIFRQAGKGALAVVELEKAVAASPRQPIFFNQLGIAYRSEGQFAKARQAYERAIALDANYAAPHLNLGILHDLYLWDGKRALEFYDRYLALSPGGDTTVVKWVADLKNRKPQHAMLSRKEKE
ncbi:MAG: tetratricopeptide repeat protein [Burkholderiaceae bacterium]